MVLLVFIGAILVAAILQYEPTVDRTPEGHTVLWYNSGGKFESSRDYIIIKRKK